MIGILRKKIDKLIHGDDGAALVITLALFMMMYISCAGVFAIGQTVKDKMILQNAADAAAYSAAIVQADTLSRIAALNREMAWTYKNLVCHQMDYIVANWLKAACDGENDPRGYDYYKPPYSSKICAGDGVTVNHITLQAVNEDVELESTVYSTVNDSGALDLASAISQEKNRISLLSASISDLISNLDDRMESVAKDVLEANLPDRYSADCVYSVKAYNYDSWSEIMTAGDEEAFLDFVGEKVDAFGVTDWFPLDASSLMRSYKDGFKFHSEWVWYDHSKVPHFEQRDYDAREELGSDVEGTEARPRWLKQDYFKDGDGVRKGAISVGVAKYNRNPWEGLVLTGQDGQTRGLYEVFQPLIGAISWTWAVASAQAGYVDSRKEGVDRKKSYEDDHDYRVDWDVNDEWNLRTDNWDAVYVPVRQSFTDEEFASWIKGGWNELSSNPASDLPDYNPSSLTSALPQMHNSGVSTATLNWSELRNGMYH